MLIVAKVNGYNEVKWLSFEQRVLLQGAWTHRRMTPTRTGAPSVWTEESQSCVVTTVPRSSTSSVTSPPSARSLGETCLLFLVWSLTPERMVEESVGGVVEEERDQ